MKPIKMDMKGNFQATSLKFSGFFRLAKEKEN